MEENSVTYFAATNYGVEMQAENDYSAISKNAPNGAQAFASDHCYGLPYQDHNYGAVPPPSRSMGGVIGTRQRLNSAGSYTPSTQTPVQQPAPVAAFAAAHRMTSTPGRAPPNHYQIPTTTLMVGGPPALERNNCSEEETTTVEIFSPTPNDDRSPLFFQTLNMAPTTRDATTPQQQLCSFKPNGEVEVATSTPIVPPVNVLGDYHARGVIPPRLRQPTTLSYDEESHSYAVHTKESAAASAVAVSDSGLRRNSEAAQQASMAVAPSAAAKHGQHAFIATQTNAPGFYGGSKFYALSSLPVNLSSDSFIGRDRYPSDGLQFGSPPPPTAFDIGASPPAPAFPNNLESAPFVGCAATVASSVAPAAPDGETPSAAPVKKGRQRGRKPKAAKVQASTYSYVGADGSTLVLPSNVPVIPIDLPDDPTSSAVIEAAVAADAADAKSAAANEASDGAQPPQGKSKRAAGGGRKRRVKTTEDGAVAVNAANFSQSYNTLMDRLIKQLGVDDGLQTSKATKRQLKKFQAAAAALNKKVAEVKASKAAAIVTTAAAALESALPVPPSKIEPMKEEKVAAHDAVEIKAKIEHIARDSNTETDDEDETTTHVVHKLKRKSLSKGKKLPNVVPPAPPPAIKPKAGSSGEELSSSSSEESSSSAESESDSSNSQDEWAGQDYTTSCLCDMKHNDDFMIQCDRCDVWQHCECMGLRKKSIPDKYLCHGCNPRELKLTREQARSLQTRKKARMAQQRREKARRRQQRKLAAAAKRKSETGAAKHKVKAAATAHHAVKTRPPPNAKRRAAAGVVLKRSEVVEEFYANFTNIEANEYSNEVAKAMRNESDSIGVSLLDQLPIGTPCLVMYVSKERRGLVANLTIPPDQPILEFRGKVCTVSEFTGRDADGRVLPYVLFYRGLQKGDGSQHNWDLCVDARFRGTDARFVRRSCQPNTQVRHVIKNGELHLLLISTELIESATEVTIPFDYDFRLCKYDVECACKILGTTDCPVERCNEETRRVHQEAAMQQAASKSRATSSNVLTPKRSAAPQRNSLLLSASSSSSAAVAKAQKLTKRAMSSALKSAPKTPAVPKNRRRRDTVSPTVDEPPTPVTAAKPKLKVRLGFKVRLKDKKERQEQAPASKPVGKKKTDARKAAAKKLVDEVLFGGHASTLDFENDLLQKPPNELSEADLREEKKMKQLMEQIARMEEREKKRQQKLENRPSTSHEKSVHKIVAGQRKRGSSSTSVELEKMELEPGEGAEIKSPSPSSFIQRHTDFIHSAAAPVAEVGRNVAKKRWLRQALSEESSKQNENEEQAAFVAATSMPSAVNETVSYAVSVPATDSAALGAAPLESPRPSSSMASSDGTPSTMTASAPPTNSCGSPPQPPPKKVRMSLDEYKKRSRKEDDGASNDGKGFGGDDTSPSQAGSTTPADSFGGCGPTTTAAASSSKSLSFIPQLNEATLLDQSVRLGSLPDPKIFGKTSSTLEDLRRRIYGKTWGAANASDVAADGQHSQYNDKMDQDYATDTSRPRMSLMDRLKTEFGLDDPA